MPAYSLLNLGSLISESYKRCTSKYGQSLIASAPIATALPIKVALPERKICNLYVVELAELDDAGRPTGGLCYYVGRTMKDLQSRFEEHKGSGGVKW